MLVMNSLKTANLSISPTATDDRETSQRAAERKLFPLRLTPVELCLMLEESPSHPMQFFLRLRLTGRLHRDALRQALRAAIARHPLASAIVKRRWRGWYWMPVDGWEPTIRWLPGPVSDDLPTADRIDIHHEPGLRVAVVEGEHESDVVLQFQHTWCDGLGAADFASDLLTAYANIVDEQSAVRCKRLDTAALRHRGWEGLTLRQWTAWLFRRSLQVRQFDRCYKRKPILLAAPKAAARRPLSPDYPQSQFHRYSRSESAAIQRFAQGQGTTVNSLLLRDLFCLLRDWRLARGADHAEQLRLATPVSLRTTAHRNIPAANIVSMICFDRKLGETLAEDALLKSLDEDLDRVRANRWDLVFSYFLRVLQFWPTQLAKGLRRKRFAGTLLMTNLGPALANSLLPRREGKLLVGGHMLERVDFLPVLRPGHGVTVGVSTYAGSLSLSMQYDGCAIDEAAAETLLNALVDRLAPRTTSCATENAAA
jgi:hypothetical protein